MMRSIKTLAILLAISVAFTACTQSKEKHYPFKQDLAENLYAIPLSLDSPDSLITIKTDTGTVTFHSDIYDWYGSNYRLDTLSNVKGYAKVYRGSHYANGADSTLISYRTGEVLRNILYSSDTLIITGTGPYGARQGNSSDCNECFPEMFYWSNLSRLNIYTRSKHRFGRAFTYASSVVDDSYFKLISRYGAKVPEDLIKPNFSFSKLENGNIILTTGIPEALNVTGQRKYVESGLFTEDGEVSELTGLIFDESKLLSDTLLRYEWGLQTITLPLGDFINRVAGYYYSSSVDGFSILTSLDLSKYPSMVEADRKARRRASQRKLEEYSNSLNSPSTSTRSSSSNIDGSYSSESSQATYRLTISNGRWSFSTAIKISGIASTDYSSGTERNGTLYMGGANVGSANGSCASVGRSPQMCK